MGNDTNQVKPIVNKTKYTNKQKVLMMLFAAILLLSVITVSYAFFSGGVDNTNQQTAEIQAGTMSLVFSDNDSGVSAVLDFGDSITKKFTIENTGTLDAYAKISWKNLVNSYLSGSLVYTLSYSTTSTGNTTNIVSDKNVPTSSTATTTELANGILVPAGKKYYYTLTITLVNSSTVEQTADLNASFASYFTMEEGTEVSKATLTALGLTVNSGTPTFSSMDETDEGIYAAEDDYGTSYYFRGAVTNNYVEFAGFYWRIIRINGDGSLRIIYDGTEAHANGESSEDRVMGNSAFNDDYDDNAYVGYMYGTAGSSTYDATHANTNSSTIKQYLDSWYEKNIKDTEYEEAISDTLFCGDRSLSSGTGVGTKGTYYGAYSEMLKNGSLILTCPQKNDAYTVSDTTNGNGALTYPIALASTLEIFMAGSYVNDSESVSMIKSQYLYKGVWYWSLSPYQFYDSRAIVFCVAGGGYLYYIDVDYSSGGVAPVINLTYEYVSSMSGTGTMTDPYTS